MEYFQNPNPDTQQRFLKTKPWKHDWSSSNPLALTLARIWPSPCSTTLTFSLWGRHLESYLHLELPSIGNRGKIIPSLWRWFSVVFFNDLQYSHTKKRLLKIGLFERRIKFLFLPQLNHLSTFTVVDHTWKQNYSHWHLSQFALTSK